MSYAVLGPVAVAVLLTVVGVTWCAMRACPRLGATVLVDQQRRIGTLDGLRGILALSVVVGHGVLFQTGDWSGYFGMPTSNFQSRLGSCAVELFFMISAYLFCGSLFRTEGRLTIVRFFENRFMRIVPLYALCILALVLYAFYQQSFALTVSPSMLVKQVLRWSLFGFLPTYDINGVVVSGLFGQFWSLRYEWMLYFCIPVFAFAVRRTRSSWPVLAGLALIAIYYPMFAFFVAGAAAAKLETLRAPLMTLGWQVAGLAGIVAAMFLQHGYGGWLAAIALTPFFIAVLQGAGAYRGFAYPPLRYLGEISYSVYLIHGFTGWAFRQATGDWSGLGPGGAYLAMTGWALCAVAGGTVTFLLVERPTMRWKPVTHLPPRFTRRLSARTARSQPLR